jgi:hypothetical protein
MAKSRALKDARKVSSRILGEKARRRSGRGRVLADTHHRLAMSVRRVIDRCGKGEVISLLDKQEMMEHFDTLMIEFDRIRKSQLEIGA